ncbi:MAG: hypothetical protein J6P94_06565 [Oscillospiraceae bacterium]|nr:hypothetical protein [Oscillospiraceae bacterium]
MSEELIKRAEDLRERCERSCCVTSTLFLTPAEQYALSKWASRAAECKMIFRGGVKGSERNAAFVLPFYMVEEDFDESEFIRCIKVTAGFGQPSHRDYMGAVLGLGIKREWLGDILVEEGNAHVFCLNTVMEHLLASLDKVGRYGVKTKEIALSEAPKPKIQLKEVTFSVMSLRLDAVAAGMFNLSRTSAAAMIAAGEVSLNYSECLKCDAQIAVGDVISLRGHGKGSLASIGGQSRKGRTFVTAEIRK